MNRYRLFIASCLALIVTAMSFAIRGDIMGDFETVFALDKVQLGYIAGAAFWGFGLSIFFGGPLCDFMGMSTIMWLAAAGHVGGILLTIFAPNFSILFLATLLVGVGNGLVEAAVNPLIATIYPDQKTKKLTVLHAWFPGGIVIGGVLCYMLSTLFNLGIGTEWGWKIKMLLMLPVAAIYIILFKGQKFPPTERKASGISGMDMFKEALRPLLIVIWVCMWLTAATELGTNAWIPNIYLDITATEGGILVLVFINGLMWALRQFGSPIAHKLSPVMLIAVTSIFAFCGLILFGTAAKNEMLWLWYVAAALFAVGVCYWWPTMLGITSERFPKGGAFLLALIGGTGAISTAVAGPVMGWLNEKYGTANVLPIWSILPVIVFIIFSIVFFSDKAKGGYKVEKLTVGAEVAEIEEKA